MFYEKAIETDGINKKDDDSKIVYNMVEFHSAKQ